MTPALLSLSFSVARDPDAAAVASVRAAAAIDLTERFGRGYWSSQPTERGVLSGMHTGIVVLARRGPALVATTRLSTRKPWAIDAAYFTLCNRPLYLTDMAVRPDYQGRGIGRALLGEAARLARAWPADALRLDAFNADAGASGFYIRCGFRQVGVVEYRDIPLVYFEQPLTPVE
ncbi:MAG TPA: GNAT family N-acetyltransferase [Gemmatimonas sp.]|nr:GNAT family N-acetyltransferase [Gemmatimonas sp.]